MAMYMRTALCLLAGIVVANGCFAQGEESKRAEAAVQLRFYRLDFVVKELENDKIINSRLYAALLPVNSAEAASIRAGTRVPYASSPLGTPSRQYNYYDVGVNIDCRQARELASGHLALTLNVDVSSVVVSKEGGGDLPPVVRNTKWSSLVVVPTKKPTIVFSSDDPSGNRKMQLELTATPIT
jgi:hypothetical protein